MKVLRVVCLILLVGLAANSPISAAAARSCAQARTFSDAAPAIFPFFGMGILANFRDTVTIHFDPNFRASSDAEGLVRDAIQKWESTCQVNTVPVKFRINATDPRPDVPSIASETYATTLLISVDPNKIAEVRSGKMVTGGWFPDKNQIILPGRCPTDGKFGLPCRGPNLPIDWGQDRRWTIQILAHELGHAMGLDHDGEDRDCRETLMAANLRPGDTYQLESYHCQLIRKVNDPKEPCSQTPLDANAKVHPCNQEVRLLPYGPQTPGGPGGMGHGESVNFCAGFAGICDSPFIAWRGGGIDCSFDCVSWHSSYGDKGGGCRWDCHAAPLLTESLSSPTKGAAPLLAFLNLREGDTLAGRPVLRGFAMDFLGVAVIELFWNGQRISPRSLRTGLVSPEACTFPLGLYHAHCVRESGFQAEIDTTLLPNGPGTLALVATDFDGWTSSLELDVTIANTACGDILPPQVQITRPSAGSAVGGAVRVEVAAQDDFGVQSVELLANGQRVGLRTQEPYAFSWETSGLPVGYQRLLARATDRCGNVGASTEVSVLVDNRQAPYLGSPMALPRRIEAEHYDLGLPGVSYADTTPGNAGGQLRQDDVDVGVDGGQFVVGYVAAGEWLEYTVDSIFAERYRVWLRSASPSGGQVALAVDGVEGQAFTLPASGGYSSWTVAAAPEALAIGAGRHVLRLRAVTAGFNLDWLELEALPGACIGGSSVGCLQNQRFAVSAVVDGQNAVLSSVRGDTAFFTVFDPQNVELAVKILDARPINGKFWVYHGSLTTLSYTVTVTDTSTGRSRNYFKTDGSLCGGSDTGSFPLGEGGAGSLGASCTDTATSVCLLGERYRAEVLRGSTTAGASRITGQTGSFTFFSANNHEVVVKVLDGSTWNGHRWVFFGSLTDQAYQVRVTDTVTNSSVVYPSPAAFCGRHDFDDF